MNKLNYFFILWSCFILKQGLVAQVVPPPATQTEVNTGVNRFKYVTPYTLANSTIVGTNVALSAQGGTALLTNLNGTGAMTNKWNSWVIYGNPVTSNSMFAVNRGLGIVTNSTSFSGLMQSIVNRGADGFDIEIMPNYYASNSYSADATIIITNYGIIRGGGNPVTVIRATAALNGPVFQVGTTANPSGGINRFKDIRIEGDNAGANGVGIKIVNCAEPVFRDMETTGFKRAGIELASTNYMHWAYADHCWFVTKDAGAKGILVSDGPLASVRHLNHFDINDCNFGIFGGGESILVAADFPSFRVTDSIFKYSSGTMEYNIRQTNGPGAIYSGNKFVGSSGNNPVQFAYVSGGLYTGVTNLYPKFVNNSSDGTVELIVLGQFVTNVVMIGNSIQGSGPVVVYEDIASNGRINNLDATELRLGSVLTNALLMTDAYGMVKTTALSGLTLSGGTLTASGSGSPGGTTTTIQYNQAGAFAGSSNFTYTEASQDISLWAPSTTASITVGYTNNSNGRSNYIDNSGMLITSVSGSLGGGIGVNAGGVLNSLTIYTNSMSPPYTMHTDFGGPLVLFRSGYFGSNMVVGGTLTSTNGVTIPGGTSPGEIQMNGTNAIGVVLRAANSNSFAVTNIMGSIDRASAATILLDANHAHDWIVTNRITAATAVVFTNISAGQEYTVTMLGEASGGTSRVITFTDITGLKFVDLDAFGVAQSTSKAFTLTNGNAVETSWRVNRLLGTNIIQAVTRQFAY